MKTIEKLRKEKGYSQARIAEATSVTVATVSRWESGEFAPQADKLPLLAKALGCTIDDLFKED